MLKTILKGALAAAFVSVPLASHAMDDAQRAEVENIIREYLLENPELLAEMQDALQAKQAEQQAIAQANALTDLSGMIYESDYIIQVGDPDAPFTVVEFFDYNCGFCRRSLNLFEETAERHPDVRFIFKEYPILSEDSLEAHKVSIALSQARPDLYRNFHVLLMGASGRVTGAKAREVAINLGMDEAQLDAALAADSIDETIRESYRIADALGINGTPGFIIGDEVVPGAISMDDLEARYDNLRECGSTRCG
ncbi:MAG: DsbA family protein [Pseudomonadota bacterium]